MQTLMVIAGMLVLGLIALVFLYVFLKIVVLPLNNPYTPENDLSDADTQTSNIDLPSFKMGLNQGFFMVQMGLYKIWVEGGSSMLIGTYENLRTEIDQNVFQFFSDKEKMQEWNDKFGTFLKENSKKEDK
jgi:hypothetical protein